MNLSSDGYLRPSIGADSSNDDGDQLAAAFRRICPGVRVTAQPPEAVDDLVHPTFGRLVAAWQGYAADGFQRHRGSSGGVLTALSRWMLEEKAVTHIACATRDPAKPTRTVAVTIADPSEVLTGAGSRYAPVDVASLPSAASPTGAVVAKPCEVTAIRARSDIDKGEPPVLLSFFCAGTPSQHATDRLIRELGFDVDRVQALTYRGNGWPGSFEVVEAGGSTASLSYEESWGRHLGRELQWRCKICPDGTGNDSDVSVGDLWQVDEKGYPLFENSGGNSVIIARTRRGADLVERAAAAGVLVLAPVDLDKAAGVQPLQVDRKRTLAGRLAARLLVLRPGPRYRGHSTLHLLLTNKRANLRAMLGGLKRALLRRQTPQDW